MKNMISGLIAMIIGVFGFTLFFPAFLNFIAGILPISLITGGSLVLYLKHGDQIADYWKTRGIPDLSSKTDPSPTEPIVTEPIVTKPIVTKPIVTEPIVTEAAVTEAVATEAVATEAVEKICNLLGNPGSLVFHSPDCRYSKNEKCTLVFSSREDALQQGFRPCGVCKP